MKQGLVLLLGQCFLSALAVDGFAGEPPAESSERQTLSTVMLPVPGDKPLYYCWEPHIAVDPTDPSTIVATAAFRGQAAKGNEERPDWNVLAWRSEDGGRSWSDPVCPLDGAARPKLRFQGDSVLAFGKGKTCWLAGLDAEGYESMEGGVRVWRDKQCLKVSPSKDGGKKWLEPITIAKGYLKPQLFLEKPWLAVDTTDGKRRGTLYVAWNEAGDAPWSRRLRSALLCAALTRGADHSTPSVVVSEQLFVSSGRFAPFMNPLVQLAVRSDGTLDVVWFDMETSRDKETRRLLHAFSRDGAQTFSQPTTIVSDIRTMGDGEFPSLASTPDGNLLLAWGKQGRVICSVLASGQWSVPVPLADNLPEGVRLSYPTVAATPNALWVLAYRRERTAERVSVVLYRSDDQGKHWRSDRVLASREFKDAMKFRPGDYVGLASAKESI